MGAMKLFGVAPLAFLAAHAAAWLVSDLILIARLEGGLSPMAPLYWLAREVLALPMWAHVLSGNTVNWRGTTLKLLPGGGVTPVEARA
jgi:hypothetical protein